MAVVSLNDYADIQKTKYPFWRLELTNWGNRQTGAVATSLIYPAGGNNQSGPSIPGGAQLITLGPDSTADQFIVDYNQILTPGTFPVPDPGVLNQQSLTVGINRPAIMVPGPMIYRTAFSTMFGDDYIKDGVAGTAQLGTNAAFEAPRLQVLTYLQAPTVQGTFKRNDMYRSANVIQEDTNEVTLGIWPVMGRRAMAVYARASGTMVGTIRVARIVDFIVTPFGARPVEETVLGAQAINGATAVQASVVTSKSCQFLAVYSTRASGTGGTVVVMIASDEYALDSPSAA